MDKSKAKKAVKKSKGRKASSPRQAEMPLTPGVTQGINPEIVAQNISLQPADGYVNPYRELGTVVPSPYAPGNILPGYNSPRMTGG
jgi:hypothetical protein